MTDKNTISGLICEFNPLHNGHLALLRHMRQDSGGPVVCVMSGNFVQRGDAAILDKWTRARLALQCGADLVVELPLPWALAGAERFARGGIALLQGLGAARLYFGSECGDVKPLRQIADYLLSPAFDSALRPRLDDGEGFAAARAAAIAEALGAQAAALNAEPNNILGIEYLKALTVLSAPLAPHTLRRLSVAHDSAQTTDSFASASRIREISTNIHSYRSFVPYATQEAIETLRTAGQYPTTLALIERGILAKLSTMEAAELAHVPDVSEGLENRLLQAAGEVQTLTALYDAVKSKRYSHARVRRIVLSAYLGLDDTLPALPPYLRVLGMTAQGAAILGAASLPLLLRPSDLSRCNDEAKQVFSLEARADDVYSLCTETRRRARLDYTTPVIKL